MSIVATIEHRLRHYLILFNDSDKQILLLFNPGPADLSRDFVDLNLSGMKALDAMEEIHGFRLLQLIDSCLHRFIKGFVISHFEGNNFAIEIPGPLFLPLLRLLFPVLLLNLVQAVVQRRPLMQISSYKAS
ncbi:hypothetical protein QVD17_06809 [Tagetes erecta]|uniref:Uncharacterized protein n=1 Tax=Tagetes erecta TaxID=13708 RepID=A0AAD8PBJ9_TARER|nr:hypothetical protein QVD17_06809 [Tagetes erecta]